ncbi:MAG TPA: hypothetical protein VH684_00380 [Xanthobacteraceae bacterium]|jgi:hypothetical protein
MLDRLTRKRTGCRLIQMLASFVITFAPVCVSSAASGADSSTPVNSGYFGMHVFSNSLLSPWPPISFGSLRLWDLGVAWADINKSEGVYNFKGLDSYINLVSAHGGVDLVYTFGHVPSWASSRSCLPPSNLQYWTDFVRAIVTHAAGKIKYWEVWNEPESPQFWCSDMSTLITLQSQAYGIIKSLDRTAMVLMPSTSGSSGPSYMTSLLAAGSGRYGDIMSFHGYVNQSGESIAPYVGAYKSVLSRYGQGSKPMWDTEAGFPITLDTDHQVAYVAQYHLLQWPLGVARFYWYGYDSGDVGGLQSSANRLSSAGVAYREVGKWMSGAVMKAPCAQVNSSGVVWTCSLVRANGYSALAVWASGTAPQSYSAPSPYTQQRDLTGAVSKIPQNRAVSIGIKPILLETGTAF